MPERAALRRNDGLLHVTPVHNRRTDRRRRVTPACDAGRLGTAGRRPFERCRHGVRTATSEQRG